MESTQPSQSSYIIDSSSGAEMARLIDQDLMITQSTGVFPATLDLTDVYRILDVACGPGGWAREAARQLPDTTIVGVDIDVDMINYANAFATVELLHNLSFQVMDVRQPLPFADASFDLVHARLLVGLIYQRVWPVLVQEYARITKPGGWIVLTEADVMVTTNSQAEETLFGFGVEAMLRAGFYAGKEHGLTQHLPTFLADAGLTDIHTEHHTIDISSGTPGQPAIVSNLKIAFILVQPFLLKMGISTQEEITALYEQAIQDMEQAEFRGQMNLTTVWGRKKA